MKIRTKRWICAVVCVLGFMTTLGAVGSIEFNTVPLSTGIVVAIVGILVCGAAGYKGGYIK